MSARLKAVETCFKARNKICGTADPMPRCLAAQASGPKAEAKVVTALDKALAKFSAGVAKKCNDTQVAALDACGDTQAALASCMQCSHGNSAETQVAADYKAVLQATTGTGLQPVADLAEAGDTIVIEPGTYSATMTLKDTGLTVLGHKTCSTGARPLIDNPGSASIGIFSCGSLLNGCPDPADNQVIQSLEVNNFIDYDVYTTGANGVTYRDLVTRGPETINVTRYGPFPILSNNVLIEDCFVSGISDAGIYVGQSTNIVVRNNEVQNSVAGIEIENSANAEVYGNYAHDNTAGILIFKLPGLPVQFSNCHNIHDNVSSNNNHPNFGTGYLELVPTGTGMLYLSNDSGWFHNNTITGNGTLGFTATDQGTLNALNDPDPFNPPSADSIPVDNFITNNILTGNGGSPDPNFVAFASDLLVVQSPGSTGNCQSGNTIGTALGQVLPACVGAQPSGCPFIPPPTTTTTSTTTTTVTVPTTTTTLAPTFTNVYTSIISPRCAGCHDTGNNYAGLNMDTQPGAYTDLVNVPSTELPTMDRVEPGDPANSYMKHKVDGTAGSVGGNPSQMPLTGGPLTQAQRDLIRDWILAGAAND